MWKCLHETSSMPQLCKCANKTLLRQRFCAYLTRPALLESVRSTEHLSASLYQLSTK